MTRAEALVALGLDGPLPADQLHRAYLRAVKVHRPERDPEGFRRVREAYELLKTGAAFAPVDVAPLPEPERPPEPPPQPLSAPVDDAELPTAQLAEIAGQPMPRARLVRIFSILGHRGALPEAVQVYRELVRTLPESPAGPHPSLQMTSRLVLACHAEDRPVLGREVLDLTERQLALVGTRPGDPGAGVWGIANWFRGVTRDLPLALRRSMAISALTGDKEHARAAFSEWSQANWDRLGPMKGALRAASPPLAEIFGRLLVFEPRGKAPLYRPNVPTWALRSVYLLGLVAGTGLAWRWGPLRAAPPMLVWVFGAEAMGLFVLADSFWLSRTPNTFRRSLLDLAGATVLPCFAAVAFFALALFGPSEPVAHPETATVWRMQAVHALEGPLADAREPIEAICAASLEKEPVVCVAAIDLAILARDGRCKSAQAVLLRRPGPAPNTPDAALQSVISRACGWEGK